MAKRKNARPGEILTEAEKAKRRPKQEQDHFENMLASAPEPKRKAGLDGKPNK